MPATIDVYPTMPAARAAYPAGQGGQSERRGAQPPHAAELSRSRWFPRPRSGQQGPLPSLAGRIVLVVDDDPDALDLLRLVLESCGARVLAASSTMHARGYLATATPDIIVCDLALPREDGRSFLRDVRRRRDSAVARVPAIAVTAFYEDYPPATASEFAAYFQKPIDIDALTRTIARLLDAPDAGRAR
jgi:CheY-like chemotaxis protein